MNKKAMIILGVTLLAGCAAGNIQKKSSQTNQNQNPVKISEVTENATLRVLYKPRVLIGRDLKGTVTKEVLQDYSAQVPNAQESAEVQNNCSPNGLTSVTGSLNNPLVDVGAYSQAMALGKDIAQKRAVWKFYVDQTNKADQAVPRSRYEQTKAARAQKIQREKDAGYITSTGRFDSRKLSKDILRGMGLEKDPVAERQKAEENAYEEFKRDLEYNKSVLAAQDQQISTLEQNYVNKLSVVYLNALNNLISIPADSVNPETLKQFSNFRTNNIYLCIYERTSSKSTWPTELVDDRSFVNSPYEKYATNVILVGANDAVKKLKSSTTSSGIETEFHYLYPTDELKRVALSTPAIGDIYKTRSSQIKAEEKRKYDEQQRKLAEEAARQAKLKIKNNSTPSLEDVQRAILNASVEKTNGELKLSHTVVTSSYSYDRISNLLGSEFKTTEMRIAVKNLSCRKEKSKQRCSYDEAYNEIPFVFGAAFAVNSEKIVRRENLFYWTMNGLVADKGVEVAYYIPPPPSSGGGDVDNCPAPCDNRSTSDKIQDMWDSRRAAGLPTYGN